jgi:hypothetical protein
VLLSSIGFFPLSTMALGVFPLEKQGEKTWGGGSVCEWIGRALLTQKVHLAPNTQQAEQAGFARAKSNDDVPVNFSWKLTKR